MTPGIACAIAKWAPPQETGKFVFTSIGGTLGTVLTWPFVAYLMTHFGWVYAFYIPATIVLFIAILWYYIVYNSPAEHPRITEHELKFIEESQGHNVSRTQVYTHFHSIQRLWLCVEWTHWNNVVLMIFREDGRQFYAFSNRFHSGHFSSCILVTCGHSFFWWYQLQSIWMR